MCTVGIYQTSSCHSVNVIPCDILWQSHLVLTIFGQESAYHTEVGISAHASLIAVTGAFALEHAVGLAHTVVRLILKVILKVS